MRYFFPTSPVVCLTRLSSVLQIKKALSTTHNLFPVVEELVDEEGEDNGGGLGGSKLHSNGRDDQHALRRFGKVMGVVTRDQVAVKLMYRFYETNRNEPAYHKMATENWKR